jgi:hypothetical protein
MNALTAYAQAGARLVDNGYSAFPIIPGQKIPGVYKIFPDEGKCWRPARDWERFCDRLPTDIELSSWDNWPDAGVGVAIDQTLKVIDIDTEDQELNAAILDVLPDSPVKKRGNRGFSAFYKGSEAITSRKFKRGKDSIVEILAHGAQTVVPPTMHPDTGKPYEWLTSDTLIDTSTHQLPELPDDIEARLAATLAPFGCVPEERHGPIQRGEGDNVWSVIKDIAMQNFDAWVPALGLPKTKRHSGGGYRAVAAWRGVKNANLAFHATGIRDHADIGYTPIAVVMAALGKTNFEAAEWLCEKMDYWPQGWKPDPEHEAAVKHLLWGMAAKAAAHG